MGQTATAPAGINQLTDRVIASDLLMCAKLGINIYTHAITESATPAIRTMLKKQLDQAITFQEQVSAYMADRGWYNAADMVEQLKTDVKKTQETMSMLK